MLQAEAVRMIEEAAEAIAVPSLECVFLHSLA